MSLKGAKYTEYCNIVFWLETNYKTYFLDDWVNLDWMLENYVSLGARIQWLCGMRTLFLRAICSVVSVGCEISCCP